MASSARRPQDCWMARPQRRRLKSVRQGALSNEDQRFVSERAVRLGGHPGLELVTALSSGQIRRARTFLFQNAMVYVSVIGSEADVARPTVDRFLESLRVK